LLGFRRVPDKEPDSERGGLAETLIKVAVALGASEAKMRWRMQRLENWWRRKRRGTEQRVEQIRYKNKICPSCRAINSIEEKRCSECGGRLGSRAWQVLDRIGLVVPSVVSASTLLGICFIAVYARILFAQHGDSAWSLDNYTLLRFGGNFGPITTDGEWWRLLSSIVSHGGLVHLGFNLIALYIVGPEVEKLYGRFVMPLLFAATGVIGSLASAYLNDPPAVAIGASGGIMGLIGVAAIRGHLEGTHAGRDVRDRMVKWVIYTFILGFAIPGIDNWGHAGGLAAGAGLGYLVRPRWIADHFGRRVPLSFLGIAAAGAAVWLAVAPPASAVDAMRPPGEVPERFDPVTEVYAPAAEACALDDPAETRRRLEAISAAVQQSPPDWCVWIDQVRAECGRVNADDLELQQRRDWKRVCAVLGAERPDPEDRQPE
jgi:rhomboid protease GluP